MARELEYVSPFDLTIIGLDTDHGKDHPLYDERVYLSVDENLVKNIKVYGIQQPVLVRKDGTEFIVVDGRQRVRAARQACEEAEKAGEHPVKVPVRIVVATDARATGIMISTNELRHDDDVLAKAFKAQRLYAQYGDLNEVAIAFGRSVQTIRNWLSLIEADPKIHECIRSNKLSYTTAIEIARLKREDQAEQLDKFLKAAANSKISDKAVRTALVGSDPNQGLLNKGDEEEEEDSKPQRKSGKEHNHQGIKRTWLRRALKTSAAEALTDEQRGVLEWFCNGEGADGDWFQEFMVDATSELEGTGLKRGRPSKAKDQPKDEPKRSKGKKAPVAKVDVQSFVEADVEEEDSDDLANSGEESDDFDWRAELDVIKNSL